MTREEAYKEIGRLAEQHALIAQAFGGVITVVHPKTQREYGIEAKCLYMAGQGPWPGKSQATEGAPAEAPPKAAKPSQEDQLDIFNALLDAEQQDDIAKESAE